MILHSVTRCDPEGRPCGRTLELEAPVAIPVGAVVVFAGERFRVTKVRAEDVAPAEVEGFPI